MEEGIHLVQLINKHVEKNPQTSELFERLGQYVNQFDQMSEHVESLENLLDNKEDEIVLIEAKLKESESQLKEKISQLELTKEKLVESERERLHVENELRDQTRLLDVDLKLDKPDLRESKAVINKLAKLEDENRRLKEYNQALEDQIYTKCVVADDINNHDAVADEKLTVEAPVRKACFKDEIDSPTAVKTLLMQKKNEVYRLEQANADLAIRLELEHDRRMRAQNAIVDIEREKSLLQGQLDRKLSEFAIKTQDYEETKVGCDYKISKVTGEMKKLEAKFENTNVEKEKKIVELQNWNKDMLKKLEDLEDRYNNQLEVSKTLQTELQVSYEENQCLEKEMEMLNVMFAELEHHIFNPDIALGLEAPTIEILHKGKKTNLDEVVKSTKGTEPSKLLQESCFNEVTTKNGTRMVLSVSKTFIKLKDLILEKKTLEEQLNKMRNINQHLCSQVNLHEEKLWSITDELNNTWNYVSKIKEQHKKLHSAEQILRAELAEKRQILNKLRQELEESRSSWNLIKQKTAESETQWQALKLDMAERKRLLCSSSESGFSETDTEEANNPNDESSSAESLPADAASPTQESDESDHDGEEMAKPSSATEPSPVDDEVFEDDIDESESIPDPFSDEEDSLYDAFNNNSDIMIRSTDTIVDEMLATTDEFPITPIFFPSVSYLAHVPSALQPPLLEPKAQPNQEAGSDTYGQTSADAPPVEEMDDNVRDLITRLKTSTARGVFLANRLSDIHRKIANGDSIGEATAWFDQEFAEEDETPDCPETEDEESVVEQEDPEDDQEDEEIESVDDLLATPSTSFASSSTFQSAEEESSSTDIQAQPPILVISLDQGVEDNNLQTYHPQSVADEDDSSSSAYLGLQVGGGAGAGAEATEDNTASASSSRELSEDRDNDNNNSSSSSNNFGAVGGDLNNTTTTPINQSHIPPAPPLPSFSLLPPSAGITVRPTYNDLYDDEDSEDEERRHRRDSQSPESSTAVTRFLIKHLPKQLAKLRNDKAELEEKNKDLEATVLDQRTKMSEHERRADLERNKAKKLEEILKQLQEVQETAGRQDHPPINQSQSRPEQRRQQEMALKVGEYPVVMESGGQNLTWRIQSTSEDSPGYWLTYVAPGCDEEVVLPNQVVDVEADPAADHITTTIMVNCAHPGTFTLHIKGPVKSQPQVLISVKDVNKKSNPSQSNSKSQSGNNSSNSS